jgi:MFS family permease
MVPLFTAVGHRLNAWLPVGVIVAAGCLALGGGSLVIAGTVGQRPHYVSELLPGWLIGGIGVGLALPAILSSATADLPQTQAATGSGVVSMSRQIGTAVGVSMLVAVLGTPTTFAAAQTAFRHGWWLLAAVALAGALSALRMTPGKPNRVGTRRPVTGAHPVDAISPPRPGINCSVPPVGEVNRL